ncbi:hypothetical protein GCM10010990_18040 [Croceicoccus mobilis]|uniref:Carbamoyltransferase Kae1-like domain-containing protein n=1 Tax=Croceicoccus mobilis TaxID=1703339 RepID=A0A916Z038_9SPHN|nr:hypothetical protein GCM10010990_18040 [Croceicoccus mobilis]
MAAGVDAGIVAARLRAGFGDALMTLLDACDALAAHRLILSGGVMQNRILRHGLRERLWAKCIEPARLI